MCGRATLTSPGDDIAELFDAPPIDIGPPRFNIAPTQPILTVRSSSINDHELNHSREGDPRSSPGSDHGDDRSPSRSRELALVRWGLIPWWAKPEEAKKIASKCIQARAETAVKAPAFRDAFRRHRCLVIVDGFFEWKQLPDGRRIPHLVRQSNRKPFAIAGVWDSWRPKVDHDATATETEGIEEKDTEKKKSEPPKPERIESCAVLTTRSGGAIRDLHTRMPLVLVANEWDTWLSGSPAQAAKLLERDRHTLDERASDLVTIPISTWVNDVKHDDPKCLEPKEIEPLKGQIGFDFAAPSTAKKKTAAAARGRR